MVGEPEQSFTERVAREGEDAVARLVQELAEHPLLRGALEHAFEAREKAAQAQDLLLAALNLPSASDIERLTRRVRSVSQRMEALEDGLDRVDGRLGAIEGRLGQVAAELTAIAARLPATTLPSPPARGRGRAKPSAR